MKKETKYKVGDKVWFRFVSHNIQTTIRKIKISHKEILYLCDFYLTTASFREEELFPTEEELINHLKSEVKS